MASFLWTVYCLLHLQRIMANYSEDRFCKKDVSVKWIILLSSNLMENTKLHSGARSSTDNEDECVSHALRHTQAQPQRPSPTRPAHQTSSTSYAALSHSLHQPKDTPLATINMSVLVKHCGTPRLSHSAPPLSQHRSAHILHRLHNTRAHSYTPSTSTKTYQCLPSVQDAPPGSPCRSP